MLQMLHVMEDWKKEYHTNKEKIIFQNKSLLANVVFDSHSLNNISKNSKGFENIPISITNPDEVWSYWQDVETQNIVLRNYIVFGEKYNYICQTKNSKIIDAFVVIPSSTDKYRKGVLIWQT